MKKFPLATQEIGSIRKPRWLVKLLQDKNVSDEVKEEDNNFKESLKSNNLENQNSNQDESSTLQESIIKKIEQ